VNGYEAISMRWLPVLTRVVEKIALERQFRAVWEVGWRRLRKRAASR
jgi:hypothetical protein